MTHQVLKIDLHTHTTASDGRFSPNELLAHAQALGVSTLAFTDHDTVDAYHQATHLPDTLTLVTGCEFSTRIGKQEIHVVGLHFDHTHPDISHVLAEQKQARLIRAEAICAKLRKLNIDISLHTVREQCKLSENDILTSPHIAKTLLNLGVITQPQHAYKRYLGAGKKAFVRPEWVSLSRIIDAIHSANGIAIFAHPLGYNLTRTKRIEYIRTFAELGGDGFEVFSGKQGVSNTSELINLCAELDLIASVGSDFHAPYPFKHELGVNLTRLYKDHPTLKNLRTAWDGVSIPLR